MIGVELVSDPETRTPLAPADVLTIWEKCKDMGVLYGKGGFFGNVRLYNNNCCYLIIVPYDALI
jgi:4-aminobutyrate aminotransferase-like enzyme